MERLDTFLVENKFTESRNQAQSIIKDGYVFVNSKKITKASYKVAQEDSVGVKDHDIYVSRAAFKLKYFLEEIDLNLSGCVCLDIGSSTGGFTQVLLENNVKEVTCVDVGRDQLHHSLRESEKVNVYENCDIRKFESTQQYELVVSDVSFISLLHILNDVNRLAKEKIILLFKPQFEVGRGIKRDKHGVVVDKKAIAVSIEKFESACKQLGWQLLQKTPSKITGKEGNLEYCYYFMK